MSRKSIICSMKGAQNFVLNLTIQAGHCCSHRYLPHFVSDDRQQNILVEIPSEGFKFMKLAFTGLELSNLA